MLIFKSIIYLLVIIILAVFFTQNSSQSVDIKVLNKEYLDLSLYYVMIASFLLGIVFSLMIAGIREIRLRNQLRGANNILKNRDKEIAELRKLPLKDIDNESMEE
ncbi:LapA family protein [bacterium]|nr:LapA family protein [bacterium]MBT7311779.1 LapA family protein [bacterium]